MDFRISVIMPVYNGEKYIEKAILSVLQQDEVAELLIINDGSLDSTSTLLSKWVLIDRRIKTLVHPSLENRGRAASRNLGIKKATMPFLGFLDADDFFLPNRFKKDREIFQKFPKADGVYNAIGSLHYDLKETEEDFVNKGLTTLKKRIAPENLFYEMWPKGTSGHFSGDGLTVKSNIFRKVDLYNENLEVAEDTELYIRMSLKANLYPGILDQPVSIRGVHKNNVIQAIGTNLYDRNYFEMYRSLLFWAWKNGMPLTVLDYFWERLDQYYVRLNFEQINFSFNKSLFWAGIAFRIPKLLRCKRFLKASPIYLLKQNL